MTKLDIKRINGANTIAEKNNDTFENHVVEEMLEQIKTEYIEPNNTEEVNPEVEKDSVSPPICDAEENKQSKEHFISEYICNPENIESTEQNNDTTTTVTEEYETD